MMNTDLISRSDLMRRLERKKCGVHDKTYTDGFTMRFSGYGQW